MVKFYKKVQLFSLILIRSAICFWIAFFKKSFETSVADPDP